MLVICLFDISSDKCRRRVNKLLQGYGVRIQESVYECQLTHSQLSKIQGKIVKIIEANDRVHYYPLCGKDIAERKADGGAQVHWPKGFYVV